MEYKYIVFAFLWLAFMLPEEVPAQPGCGNFYLEYAQAEADKFKNTSVKSFAKVEGLKSCKKQKVYPLTKATKYFYFSHLDGQQTIVLKHAGEKMKLIIEQVHCESNYLIDEMIFSPGEYRIELKDRRLKSTSEEKEQNKTCSSCYKIPFNQFTKEL